MPCVSLMHRKIYRETVAKRIAARRLALAAQKQTVKAAKKAAQNIIKARKQSEKAAKQAEKARLKAEKQKIQYPNVVTAPSRLIVMPESAETTRNELNLTTSTSAQSPLFRYISNSLQDFQEGVEVRIPHARHYISFSEVPATPQAMDGSTQKGGTHSSVELFATGETSSDGRVDFLRPSAGQRPEGKVREARNDGPERRRVEEKQNVRQHRFHRRPTRAELINAESRLGSTLFGSIPAGHRREFFHDRENVWIWYEGWTEASRESHQMTVRYEVRPTGVYKKLSAGKYVMLEGSELENFRRAAHAYLQLIKRNLYHLA